MKRKKRTVKHFTLADRCKYRYVKPDDDIQVLWNPNIYIARYVVSVLKDFIPYSKETGATPCEFYHSNDDGQKAYDEWRKCMEEMLFAFEQYAHDRVFGLDEATKKRVQHGLDLFAKYYGDLWI